jgi:protein gp37
MSEKSKIEWTDATWNPTRGCTKIADGCRNCYALTFSERFRGVPGHPYEQGFDPRTVPEKLTEPLHWMRPRRIFVNSMSDLFHEAFDDHYIALVFGIMAASPEHTFQVLTKRPERAAQWFSRMAAMGDPIFALTNALARVPLNFPHALNLRRQWPLPNVWIGTSIATQSDADKNVPKLLEIPAAVRFLSCEPLVARVSIDRGGWLRPFYASCQQDDSPYLAQLARAVARREGQTFIDWVIAGGESGPGSRPCNVEWIRLVVAQCKATGVPMFVKQLGSRPRVMDYRETPLSPITWKDLKLAAKKGGDWDEWPVDLRVREFPTVGEEDGGSDIAEVFGEPAKGEESSR